VYESVSGRDNGDSGVSLDLLTRTLDVLGAGRTGLVTDIDGTLSPIVARPEEAAVLPEARGALIGLRDLLTLVAIITGRSVADARQLVDVDGLTYIGNHGLEVFSSGQPMLVPAAQAWVPRVAAALDLVALQLSAELTTGLIIENKGATASLHYRLAPDPGRTRAALVEILEREGNRNGLQLEEGRRVINLLPPLHVSKGSAVTELVREHALEGVVYLGDDVTDAHAFRALNVLRRAGGLKTLAIGVVGPETPAIVRQLADGSVPGPAAVAELLRRVLDGLKSSARMES
jgi:trehalose 6-phosphate phosphatase